MISNTTYIAQTRFGLGMRPDEIANVESDPRGWLANQIQSPQMSHTSFAALNNSQTCLREAYELKAKREEMKREGGEKVKVKQVLKETFHQGNAGAPAAGHFHLHAVL